MRAQAAILCLWLGLLVLTVALRAAPEDAAKDEKWIIVTGASSGRLVWAAFSLPDKDPDVDSSYEVDPVVTQGGKIVSRDFILISTLSNPLGIPSDARSWLAFMAADSLIGASLNNLGIPLDPNPNEAFANAGDLIFRLAENLGMPLLSDDVKSCDLPMHELPISPEMLTKSRAIELLHYLIKHFHGAAGASNFELQVKCPLLAVAEPKAVPYYVEKPIVLSVASKTKGGLSRMVRLSNLVGQNVAQERIKAFAEQGVVAPRALKENTTPNEIADYWKRFVLSPLFIEFNSVIYDDDLSCLIIDVKNNKYGETVGNVAESYWAGEILQYQ